MELAAPQPGDVLVDRVARQRVPERRPPPVELEQQSAGEELLQAVSGVQRADQIEVEDGAGDRCGLRGRAAAVAEVGQLEQDRVANGLGQRNARVELELQPIVTSLQATARVERRG